MSLRLFLPTCSCLPTLGCGLVVLISIVSPAQNHHSSTHSHGSLPPTPLLTQGQSAALLLGWLCLLAASDCVTDALQRWRQARLQAHKERNEMLSLQQHKQVVLEELQTTGLLSHMMRNPSTRILPCINDNIMIVTTKMNAEQKIAMTDGC